MKVKNSLSWTLFNKNKYQPNAIEGIGLIGHEVVHVRYDYLPFGESFNEAGGVRLEFVDI